MTLIWEGFQIMMLRLREAAALFSLPAILLGVMLVGCSKDKPTANIESKSDNDTTVTPVPAPAPKIVTPAKIVAPATIEPINEGPNEKSPTPIAPVVRPALPVPEPVDIGLGKPEVVMSEAHAKTCLIHVGDAMPELTLQHLNGKDFTLSQLYGQRLTVVVFWTAQHPYALEQFERLSRETDQPFSKFGVDVVAVNIGDSPQTVTELNLNNAGNFSSLLDPEGAALSQVATEKLPRTYLLDAEGKVLWFDIEYSLSTARGLKNALNYYLQATN